MRDLIRELVDNARRSGDRIGVDGTSDAPSKLAAESIRLARMATSIHLADAARLIADSEAIPPAEVDCASFTRELVR